MYTLNLFVDVIYSFDCTKIAQSSFSRRFMKTFSLILCMLKAIFTSPFSLDRFAKLWLQRSEWLGHQYRATNPTQEGPMRGKDWSKVTQ